MNDGPRTKEEFGVGFRRVTAQDQFTICNGPAVYEKGGSGSVTTSLGRRTRPRYEEQSARPPKREEFKSVLPQRAKIHPCPKRARRHGKFPFARAVKTMGGTQIIQITPLSLFVERSPRRGHYWKTEEHGGKTC